MYIVTNEPISKGLRSKNTVIKGIADQLNVSADEVYTSHKCIQGKRFIKCLYTVDVSVVDYKGTHHIDSTQRTQSGNRPGEAFATAQFRYACHHKLINKELIF